MTRGLLAGLLRLKNTAEQMTGTFNRSNIEALSDHDLRDLGMLDGRISPSTVERCARSVAWDMVDRGPHSL